MRYMLVVYGIFMHRWPFVRSITNSNNAVEVVFSVGFQNAGHRRKSIVLLHYIYLMQIW